MKKPTIVKMIVNEAINVNRLAPIGCFFRTRLMPDTIKLRISKKINRLRNIPADV